MGAVKDTLVQPVHTHTHTHTHTTHIHTHTLSVCVSVEGVDGTSAETKTFRWKRLKETSLSHVKTKLNWQHIDRT